MEIILLLDPDEKEQVCREILGGLMDWFWTQAWVDYYATNCRELVFYAATKDGRMAGFLVVKRHYDHSAEIFVLGVRQEFHKQGVGRLLLEECEKNCKSQGIKYLTAKTLSEKSSDGFYAKTRKFYEAMGFCALETLEELWGADRPCLIMVKSLD